MKPESIERYIFILSFNLIIISSSLLYYFTLSKYAGIWVLLLIQTIGATVGLYCIHIHFMRKYRDFTRTLKEYLASEPVMADLDMDINPDKFPSYALTKLIQYLRNQKEQYYNLMEILKQNNYLLERNSKITESIFHITSEILSSGEIDEILQTILDKAIEITPNAQKGSIMIYNGKEYEFRAVSGYDINKMKQFKFEVQEVFQSNSYDFYQPCIISNPEAHNNSRLKNDKYSKLKEIRDGAELKSVLTCSILQGNEFYGLLNLDNIDTPYAFKEEDKLYIKHLAVQIGIALKIARLVERTLYLSRYDGLTGIVNRRYFEELLKKTIEQHKIEGKNFTLALSDINELKRINDTYGHEAGDLFIKRFVEAVNRNLQPGDIFARLGGDEFVMVFIDKDYNWAWNFIEKVKVQLVEIPFIYNRKNIGCMQFGYGIATFPDDYDSLDSLLRIADEKMYEDKKKIKNNIGV